MIAEHDNIFSAFGAEGAEEEADANADAEENTAAEKPKISFIHRWVWLFGGEGGTPGCGCAMSADVQLDTDGIFGPRDDNDEPTFFGTILPGTKWYNDNLSLFMLPPDSLLRTKSRQLAENSVFDLVILIAIMLGLTPPLLFA